MCTQYTITQVAKIRLQSSANGTTWVTRLGTVGLLTATCTIAVSASKVFIILKLKATLVQPTMIESSSWGLKFAFLVQNLILVVVDSSTFLPSNLKRMQLQTQLLAVFSWFEFSTRESKRTPLQRLLFGFAPRSYSSSLCSGFCSTQKSGGFQFYILHNSIFQIWQQFDYLPNCRHSATKGFGRLLTRIRSNQVHPHTVRIWKGKAVSCICIELNICNLPSSIM